MHQMVHFPYSPIFAVTLVKYVLGDTECSAGERACGKYCYNPEFHQCSGEAEGDPNPIICSKAEELCANPNLITCFNPSTQDCHTVKGGGHACFKGQKVCENRLFSQCYNPSIENCVQSSVSVGSTVCLKGQLVCGNVGTCYDPSIQDCITHANFSEACFKGQRSCSNKGCYNEGSKVCLAEYDALNQPSYYLCNVGQKVCGGTCYSPLLNEVCIGEGGNATLCPVGHKVCNEECYDPTKNGCEQQQS